MSVTPPISFPSTRREAERALDAAGDEPRALDHALTWGCGVIEGYFRAGAIDESTYTAACRRLRIIADQHRAARQMRELLLCHGLGARA